MPMPESERSVVGAGTLATAGILASAGLVASHCLGAIAFVVFGSTLGAIGVSPSLSAVRFDDVPPDREVACRDREAPKGDGRKTGASECCIELRSGVEIGLPPAADEK